MTARSAFWAAPDGARLHYREHGARHAPENAPENAAENAPDRAGATPVVCLPGLTRSARDFEALAARLAPARRVICPDMRGRGLSDRADPASYAVPVEVGDILGLLDALDLRRAVFVGTSRGGIQTMALAAARPGLVAAALLNDVGPALEREGLARIVAGLQAAPDAHPDWDAAAAALRRASADSFTGLSDADWAAWARRSFADVDGRPARDWDPALAAVTAAALDQPLPDLWPLFDAMAGVPLAALRGANSDLFGAATLAAMAARRPDMAAVTLPGRGHAPFLDEPPALAAIDALLVAADAARIDHDA